MKQNEILDIAYSDIGLAPWNTMEHYYIAAKLGFNAIKGDVQVTKDGKLVMCHDSGFTLDENGRIIEFNPQKNYTAINDLTFDECMRMEYAELSKSSNYCAKVASLDDFVWLCAQEKKVCYITIRDTDLDILIPEILRILKKHNMKERCIINSFTMETLKRMRAADDEITLSQVQVPFAVLTKEVVDGVARLKNAMICMFSFDPYSYDKPIGNYEVIEKSKEAMDYAKELHIPLYQAQIYDMADREKLIEYGFTGFHITTPIFPKIHQDMIGNQ